MQMTKNFWTDNLTSEETRVSLLLGKIFNGNIMPSITKLFRMIVFDPGW